MRTSCSVTKTQNRGILKSLAWVSKIVEADLFVLSRCNLYFKANPHWKLPQVDPSQLYFLNPMHGPPPTKTPSGQYNLRPRKRVVYFGFERANDVYCVFHAQLFAVFCDVIRYLDKSGSNGFHEVSDPVLQAEFGYGVDYLSLESFEANTTFETNSFYTMGGRQCGPLIESGYQQSIRG